VIRSVVYTPTALRQFEALEAYIAENASSQTAQRYVAGIIRFCESPTLFPQRGALREDLGPQVRLVGYRRRVVIVTQIDGDKLAIVGVFYGGQNLEAAFGAED
jgi:plasmid stabilization system protein ParE